MNIKVISAVIAMFTILTCNIIAQDKIYDIITLKDDMGVIKGFINEQLLGQSVSIIPSEATLKIENKDIARTNINKYTKDSIVIVMDCITLQNGTVLEGAIVEKALNKWTKIHVTDLSSQTYKLDQVVKIGKGTSDSNVDIFIEYGVLDVLTLEDETVLKGVIIEQTYGSSVKIKTIDKGVIVCDLTDIKNVMREAYDQSKDIFMQSAFMDVIHLKNGSSIKGIIIQQVPGKEISIETIGNSRFIQEYADVVKLTKEINPNKNDLQEKLLPVISEPETVGLYLYEDNKIGNQIKSYSFQVSKNNDYISLENTPAKAVDKFTLNTDISFILKVNGNIDDIISTIKVMNVVNSNKRTKNIVPKSKDLIEDMFSNSKGDISCKTEKYGESSAKLTISASKIGEYAILYSNCNKIMLIGIDK